MTTIEKILENLKSNNLVILGLGKEGLSSYKFLHKKFPDKKIFLIDEKPMSVLGNNWQKISASNNIEFATDFNDIEQNLKSPEESRGILVIKSPGIPPSSKLVLQAKKLGAKITSNTKILFQLLETLDPKKVRGESRSERGCPGVKTVGITGTKGKSTTASMIHHVLKNCGIHSFLGGNIGIPPLSLWHKVEEMTANNLTEKPVMIVLEMSSHQLNDAIISPSIAVILNILPDHLDYYDSFDEYIEAKSQISRFQTENDLVIFDNKHETSAKLANLGKAKQINFNFEKNISDNNIIYQDEAIINIDQLPVIGKHNILNSIPSIIIAKNLGCKTLDIANSLKTFETLPHRLEMISNHDGITYVNDSLATTPESTIMAINSFESSPIILIAGGYDKGLKFDKLAEVIKNSNVKHLILFPVTGEKIIKSIKTHEKNRGFEKYDGLKEASQIEFTLVNSMKEAVETAKSIAKKGDVVLLSPGAASFGLFKSYKDRGEQFRKFVSEI